MNRNDKAREVEARLHRSLMNQVRVPQLDRRFDAGVWARIEAQEQAQANPAQAAPHKSNSERWLLASNVLGIAVAAVLVLYFGLRMFSDVDLTSSLPDFSAAQNQQAAGIISWVVAATSVCVAAMFTPLGRWLRSEFT